MTRTLLAALVLTGLSLAPTAARAEDEEKTDTLGVNLWVDVPVAAVAAGLWFGSETAKARLAPAHCRFCEPNVVDDRVARAVAWRNRDRPALASDVAIFGVMPLFGLGAVALAANHDGKGAQAGYDMLLVGEAAALAQVLNQSTKFVVGRERPFVHWLPEAEKSATKAPADNNLSFYSGHTSFSFALVTGAWAVSRMRGYSWANAILAVGLPLAAGVGYLRMAAGKHYLTDVATGALLGSGVGLLVPALHRPEAFFHPSPAVPRVAVAPLADGGAMALLTWSL